MAFSSARDGLATALAPGCSAPGDTEGLECDQSLFGTTDGGQRWNPLTPKPTLSALTELGRNLRSGLFASLRLPATDSDQLDVRGLVPIRLIPS
jgi:hypothetical protein